MVEAVGAETRSGAGRLAGKAAIVTGAARGIGRAAAGAVARAGADVMGFDIAGPVSATLEVEPATPVELAETGRLVKASGAHWRETRLDQRDLPALRAAAQDARAAFGRLDILFANAGIQTFKPILDWEDAHPLFVPRLEQRHFLFSGRFAQAAPSTSADHCRITPRRAHDGPTLPGIPGPNRC